MFLSLATVGGELGETPELRKGTGSDGDLVVFSHLPAGAPGAFLAKWSGEVGSFFQVRTCRAQTEK